MMLLQSPWRRHVLTVLVVVFLTPCAESATTATGRRPWYESVGIQTRRYLNFGSFLGSATQASTPYERIAGHPVFAVTTPWGSPYMSLEKLSDLNEVVQEPSNSAAARGGTGSSPQSISEEQNEVRTVALYYLDPDDAFAAHGEMKQMDSMETTDIRITALSLGRALRQASTLGRGLPTGAPPDPLTGSFGENAGGSLRYKLVPPKRQLYYAARCIGRERVGLMSETPAQDAQMVVLGNSAIEGTNLMRRRDQRERKTPPTKKWPATVAHMEGYTGIPIFYCPAMQRKHVWLKRIVSGQATELPFFFNYEDLQVAWQNMRQRNPKLVIPEEPVDVEVFNLWDVLTSMDKDAWNTKKNQPLWKRFDPLLTPLQKRFGKAAPPGLQDITFVPSSRSVQYKERITARGNGKARLRPMR